MCSQISGESFHLKKIKWQDRYFEISYAKISEDMIILIMKSTITLSPETVAAILIYWDLQSPSHSVNIFRYYLI